MLAVTFQVRKQTFIQSYLLFFQTIKRKYASPLSLNRMEPSTNQSRFWSLRNTRSSYPRGFSQAEINGYYFHFKKCLWWNFLRLGLTDRKTEQIPHAIKMSASLAFLEPVYVGGGLFWFILKSIIMRNLKLFVTTSWTKCLGNLQSPCGRAIKEDIEQQTP